MPLQDRKPNLACLIVPAPGTLTATDLQEEVHTPLPHSPFVYEPNGIPLVMTPDTPSFHLPGIEATLSTTAPAAWSDDEDSLILSYIFHPPRPLRTAYPPGSLPPSEAIDELTSQIMQSPVWSSQRSWEQTRSRIFDVARKHSAEVLGGAKREAEVPNPNLGFGRPKLIRPKLNVLGSSSMSRQQNSMDSLYGDNEPTISEALRLSSTLQDTASRGSADELSSTESLSSPLAFTFTFNPPPSGRKLPHLPNSYPPRPTSLLQRGRSFTSQDIHRIPSTIDEYALSSDDEGTEICSPKRPDMIRSVSSPISAFTTSPPSSESSQSVSEDNDLDNANSQSMMGLTGLIGYGSLQEVELEAEPFTPLNQTFSNIHRPREPPRIGSGSSSRDTTPAGTGRSTPAITLTVDSPTTNRTPRLLNPATTPSAVTTTAAVPSRSTSSPTMSPTYTANQLANLSLDARRVPAPPPPPSAARRRTTVGSGSTVLTRSFSDGIMNQSLMRGGVLSHSASLSSNLSTLMFSAIPAAPSHQPAATGSGSVGGIGLGRPMIKRQKSNGPGLSVFVPRPAGRTWTEELRSPFEHKPVSAISNVDQ